MWEKESITEKILQHKEAYELRGWKVPPYRLTGSEHKELLNSAKKLMVNYQGIIGNFSGVQLQLVALMENIY